VGAPKAPLSSCSPAADISNSPAVADDAWLVGMLVGLRAAGRLNCGEGASLMIRLSSMNLLSKKCARATAAERSSSSEWISECSTRIVSSFHRAPAALIALLRRPEPLLPALLGSCDATERPAPRWPVAELRCISGGEVVEAPALSPACRCARDGPFLLNRLPSEPPPLLGDGLPLAGADRELPKGMLCGVRPPVDPGVARPLGPWDVPPARPGVDGAPRIPLISIAPFRSSSSLPKNPLSPKREKMKEKSQTAVVIQKARSSQGGFFLPEKQRKTRKGVGQGPRG
jgi:hypothetical protein